MSKTLHNCDKTLVISIFQSQFFFKNYICKTVKIGSVNLDLLM